MSPTLRHLLLSVVLLLFPASALTTVACTCMAQLSPYQEFKNARAVFVGKAISSKDVSITEKIRDRTYTAYERIYEFSVDESLKGLKSSKVEINVGRIDSSCYQGFAVGESYLVYAHGESEKALYSQACSRTNMLIDAAGDLHYIHELLKGVPEPRVYGSVMRVDESVARGNAKRRVTAIAGIKIVIEGEGKRFEVETDQQGLFSFERIPDGQYTVSPVLPKSYMVYFPTEEKFVLGNGDPPPSERIQQGPSAYAGFSIGWNNRVSGRIVDSEGNVIKRAKVSVLKVHEPSPVVLNRDEYDYHQDGEYEFYGLLPGRYLLSVEIRAPFLDTNKRTTLFYPTTDSLKNATEISIGESEEFQNTDIKFPAGYIVRAIEGMVVWPNGVPVSQAWVFLAAAKDSEDDDKKFDCEITDELGRFSLQAFVGAEYWVHGSSQSSGRGEPIRIKVGKSNEPVKLVIPFPKREQR